MSTLTTGAAYVWLCASDFRANRDVADQTSIDANDRDVSVAVDPGDLPSLLAAAAMLDNPQYRSHGYKDRHIVAATGTYRGVYVTVQGTMVLAALAGQVA